MSQRTACKGTRVRQGVLSLLAAQTAHMTFATLIKSRRILVPPFDFLVPPFNYYDLSKILIRTCLLRPVGNSHAYEQITYRHSQPDRDMASKV